MGVIRSLLARLLPPSPPDPRALADAARQRGDWAAAAAHYRAHLQHAPDDVPILVQLGHMLKDGGDPRSAETAYRRAMALRPDDHDIPLQLGHALKLQGRMAEARQAYELSDSLAPRNHAAEELAAMGVRPAPPPRPAAAPAAPLDLGGLHAAFRARPCRAAWLRLRAAGGDAALEGVPGGPFLLDISDLLSMLHGTGRATGIQRVQMGICRHLLDHAPGEARFVVLDGPLGPIWALEDAALDAVLRHAEAGAHDPALARALVQAALDSAAPAHLPSARLYMTLGAFWFHAGDGPLLDWLRAAGLRLGMLAYDMIPLTHPEHADAANAAAFARSLDSGAGRWDFALAISEHSAAGMRAALAARGAGDVPVQAVPLAHRLTGAEPGGWPDAARDLRGRPFVLCVGTLESRKNHLVLFQAWKLLLEEGFTPPPLVLVGKPGWRVGDLMAQLEATDFLGGRIRLLSGVSDPELAALYQEASFTVFPSFTEGWGLPVGESLALGTPCLAAMTGATPEAAGGFAGALDPFSARQVAQAVRAWAEDPAALAAERARIHAGFRPRGWAEVGEEVLAALRAALARPALPRPLPPPPTLGAEAALPESALGAGLMAPEDGVAWIIGPAATLHVEAPPGRILVEFAARPWAEGNLLALGEGGAPAPLRPGAALSCPWPGGAGRLALHVIGPLDPPPGGDPRPIRAGVRALRHLPEGAAPLPQAPLGPGDAAWAALLPGDGTLRFRADAALHLLLGLEGEALPRRMRLEPGTHALPLEGRRPLLLRWALEEDLAGRLALLEATAPPLPLAERLALLEAAPAASGRLSGLAARLAGR